MNFYFQSLYYGLRSLNITITSSSHVFMFSGCVFSQIQNSVLSVFPLYICQLTILCTCEDWKPYREGGFHQGEARYSLSPHLYSRHSLIYFTSIPVEYQLEATLPLVSQVKCYLLKILTTFHVGNHADYNFFYLLAC